jgi:hypothetical protein
MVPCPSEIDKYDVRQERKEQETRRQSYPDTSNQYHRDACGIGLSFSKVDVLVVGKSGLWWGLFPL